MFNIDHYGIIICASILIMMVIVCHLSNRNPTGIITDRFQNTGCAAGSQCNNTTNPANKIMYYSSPGSTMGNYCPGAHPQIPCTLVKKCPAKRLSEENQMLLDQYVYLSSLLGAVDVYKFPQPGYWYL